MINELKYISETENLIAFYKDKKNQAIKDYIVTCHNYINELRNLDSIEIFNELEYERIFFQVLSLVEETFRPDQFRSIVTESIVRYLDEQFMIYIIAVQKQLKKPIKWDTLIQLQYNFSIAEIEFKIKTKFEKDFTQFAIDKIKLTDLWTILKD